MDSEFRIGHWVVRPQRLCISRNGESAHITPKSMAVLQCLAAARGEVVSRNDILDTVWPNADVTDDVLTHSVTELRKAFGDSPQNPRVIETIAKKGLRIMLDVEHVGGSESPTIVARRFGVSADSRMGPLLLLGLVAALVISFFLFGRGGDVPTRKSMAVMPFVDMSEKQDQRYLADGLSEELALRLSFLEGLNVVGPRSAQMRAGNEDARTAVGQLQVDFILDGSVRRSGDDLRVVVQLLDVGDGTQIWTHAFNRDFSEIFEVQDRIAEAVAVALSVELDVGHESIGLRRTNKPDAYEEMLLGNQHFDLTHDGLEQAARHYSRATTIDPGYVWAWLRLTQVYNAVRHNYGEDERQERRRMAEAALAKALELAPDSHEVLLLATEVALGGEDWIAARTYYDRAVGKGAIRDYEAYASISSPHVHFGMLHNMGHVEEAIKLLEKVYRLQPLRGTYAPFLPQAYLSAGRYEEALAEAERAYAQPWARLIVSHVGLSAALSIDDHELILDWLERILDQLPARPDSVVHNMYRHFGDRDRSLQWLRSRSGGDLSADYYFMQWAIYYGDYELALEVMRRSRDRWNFWIPLHAPLRKTEGFKDLVRDMGLVDYWREFGWNDYCQPLDGDDFECH